MEGSPFQREPCQLHNILDLLCEDIRELLRYYFTNAMQLGMTTMNKRLQMYFQALKQKSPYIYSKHRRIRNAGPHPLIFLHLTITISLTRANDHLAHVYFRA